MQTFIGNNIVDAGNVLSTNLTEGGSVLLTIRGPLLPTEAQGFKEKCLKGGLGLYNLFTITLCFSLDIILLITATNYNQQQCEIQPHFFIEPFIQILIAFSSLGIAICFFNLLYCCWAIHSDEGVTFCMHYLSLLNTFLSVGRNVLLILSVVPLYYIRNYKDATDTPSTLEPNTKYCNELYQWSCGIIVVQIIFYTLSIIIKSGRKIFSSQN